MRIRAEPHSRVGWIKPSQVGRDPAGWIPARGIATWISEPPLITLIVK
jgi:hypothetical protein